MKLTVLVPSEDYRASAGARIRYGGLAKGLSGADISLSLEPIGDFDPAAADCDALLISKCHDARSTVAAAILSRRGKLVGVDLFDDYFSESSDSRLIRYREWLADTLKECAFSLCSTSMMAQVVGRYRPELPTHVVNDPSREHSVEAALQSVENKIADAFSDNVIRVAWFGVGDNPYFQVGLTDLYAHSAVLDELTRSGMAVELTVLTNRRSLGADGLELISRLPVPSTVIEWSEEAERVALENSLLAFLPVSARPFSAAKSLNRAFTALSYGCQILSVGHPLYEALDPLLYRDAASFLSDFSQKRLRFSIEHREIYQQKLQSIGSAETEALRLAKFINGLTCQGSDDGAQLCVVHGLSTRAEVHHLAKTVGGLSVASPYCSANLDFDIVFRGLLPDMMMAVSPDVAASVELPKKLRTDPRVAGASSATKPRRLERYSASRHGLATNVPLPMQLATYAASMQEIRRQLEAAFGPIRLIMSETSRLPVSAGVEG
jgi:hypothetical protein